MALAPGWPLNEGLRRLRRNAGLKQIEVAERLRAMVDTHRLPGPDSLAQETVSDYERGKQRIPLAWLPHIDADVFDHPKGTLLRLADLVDPLVDLADLVDADPFLDDERKVHFRSYYEFLRTEAAALER